MAGCEFCGDGFRTVTAAYVAKHAGPRPVEPIDPDPDPVKAAAERKLYEAQLAQWQGRVIAMENTVFPCPTCNGELFLRWQDGDWPGRRHSERAVTHEEALAARENEERRKDLQ